MCSVFASIPFCTRSGSTSTSRRRAFRALQETSKQPMLLCIGTGQSEEVARQQAGEYVLRIQNKGGTARICRDGPADAFAIRQNWLRGPIALLCPRPPLAAFQPTGVRLQFSLPRRVASSGRKLESDP